MSRRLARGISCVLGVLLAAPLATPAAAAQAPAVSCGSTLTRSTTLTGDLDCKVGGGLTLAQGITLDLGGHRFTGPFIEVTGGIGLAFTGTSGSATTTVRNGTIAGWGIGATPNPNAASAGSARLQNLTFSRNSIAVAKADFGVPGARIDVSDSRFEDNGDGFWAPSGDGSVTRSSFTRNRTASSGGDGSLTITRSTFGANTTGVECVDSQACTIRSNTFTGNQQGIYSYQNPNVVGALNIAGNLFSGNGTGVWSRRSYLTVHAWNNRFTGNDVGVLVQDTDGSIDGNTFTGNKLALSVTTESDLGEHSVLIARNSLRSNGDGLRFTGRLYAGFARLSANVSNSNRGWGIYAPGATDLGGNTARLNGKSPQCVGVVCH